MSLPLLGPVSRREMLLFAGAFAVLLMAFTPRLSQTFYSGDDYVLASPELDRQVRMVMLGQGRFGLAFVQWFFIEIGAPYGRTVTLYSWLALALMALASVLLARLWRVTDERWLPFVIGPLVFAHPYFGELWSFRGVPALACMALLPAMVAAERARRFGWRGLPVALALMVVSLSIYQLSFNVLAAVLLVGVLLELGRVERSWREVRPVLRDWLPVAALLPLGSLAYLVTNRVVLLVLGMPPIARTHFLPLERLPERLHQLATLFGRQMPRDEMFSTRLVTGLEVALVLLALGLLAVRVWKQRAPGKGAGMLLLSALSLFTTVGLLVLLEEWWPTPRTRIAFAFALAGHLALAYQLSGARVRQVLLVGLALPLLWGFVGINQQLSADQQLVNRLDRETASRVALRLEQHPELRDVRKVAFVGHPFGYPGTRVDGDTNVSALAIWWSNAGLMREVTGRQFERLDGDVDLPRAREACASAPKWPEEQSIRRVEELTVVCF